jgi:hypothetical protein
MVRSRQIIAVLSLLPLFVHAQGVGRYYDYSGTISWRSRLDIATGTLTGFTADSVVVTVVKDKANCSGTWINSSRLSNNSAQVERGTISGPGLLQIVVQPDHVSPGAGTFQISVACPTPATATGPAGPARFDGRQVVIGGHELPSIPDLAVLSGSDTTPHAETDSVNGATGTFTVTWHLTTTSKTGTKPPTGSDAMALRRREGFRESQ